MHMSLVCICKIVIWKALREGDEMMNTGRLKQALPYYEKVMDAVDFKVLLFTRTRKVIESIGLMYIVYLWLNHL